MASLTAAAGAASPPRPGAPAGLRLETVDRVLGTRILSWVGAVVTLVGVAFLLKLLHERRLVPPAARVAVGMGLGLACLVAGESTLRKASDLFAQSISALGVGILFLATYLSYRLFGFNGQLATLCFLAYFAALAVALAVVRRARILAGLGFLCAYMVPHLLATGEDQAGLLFSYLGLLAAAASCARALRGWWGLAPLCLAFTWLYYQEWSVHFHTPERAAMAAIGGAGVAVSITLLAATHALRRRVPASTIDLSCIGVAQVLGCKALWQALEPRHPMLLGVALVALSAFDQALLLVLLRRRASSPETSSVLILLAAGALLLVIPATLHAEGAVLAWALAACVLLEVGLRSGRAVLEAAAGVCLLAAIATGLEAKLFHTGAFRAVLNPVFLAWSGVAAAWLVAGARWTARRAARPWRTAAGGAALVGAGALGAALLSHEVIGWYDGQASILGADRAALGDARNATLLLLWGAYPWLASARARRSPILWAAAGGFLLALGLPYLALLPEMHVREVAPFLNATFVAAIVLPLGMMGVGRILRGAFPRFALVLTMAGHALLALLIATELLETVRLGRLEAERARWMRIALVSVAWGLHGALAFAHGVTRARPAYRWLGLGLLLATIVKVAAVDLARVEQIWRVLSFISLGGLLMGCSYLYVRHETRQGRQAGDGGAP